MSKKQLFLFAFLFVLAIFLYLFLKDNDFVKDKINNVIEPKIEGSFKLDGKYVGENIWEYTITGELPNPCYSATVDALVRESYPEQVTVQVTLVEPKGDEICIQVIQDFSYEGTFSASEEAAVELKVE